MHKYFILARTVTCCTKRTQMFLYYFLILPHPINTLYFQLTEK